jgi:hypothetical protein
MSIAGDQDANQPLGADSGADEYRRAPRSNLFLSAEIDTGGKASPVRVKNLSETGALLEGPAFPAVGTVLTLRRLDVQIGATVVWLAPPKCGVAFEGEVCVGEWIAGKAGPVTFGQARVDEMQATVRDRTSLRPVPIAAVDRGKDVEDIDGRVAEELAFVRRLLEALSDELVVEPIVVQRHARALQGFDLAGQILGHLAEVLTAKDREAAIREIGMEELRTRLLRKAIF